MIFSLQASISKKATVDLFSVNPKCATLGELYGEVDENTMEWADGLLSSAIRTFVKNSNAIYKESTPGTATPDDSSRVESSMSKGSAEADLESTGWSINP